MESPVIVRQPPELHYCKDNSDEDDSGFPFDSDTEEGDDASAWSDLAARRPEIAARLRARPATWGRKRRGDPDGEFAGSLDEHFSGFPFDDIPPEFRGHLPSRWAERFTPSERTFERQSKEEPRTSEPVQQPHQHKTIATQTEDVAFPENQDKDQSKPSGIPQYGLRNTVDLGQKSAADPGSLDAESARNSRSMSAPPDSRVPSQNMGNFIGGGPHPPPKQEDSGHSNVRHIPIFVEGRDEPVINKNVDHATSFAEPKQNYQPPPQDREAYYGEREVPMNFHHPPHFSRTFGTPFNKGFKQTAPFTQQKVFPQNFAQSPTSPRGRSQSPNQRGRSQSPNLQNQPQHGQQPQPNHGQQSQHPQQHQRPQTQPQQPPQQPAAPQEPHPQTNPTANDPIAKILKIQRDVLDLMTEVENFKGAKNDKKYMYLDEMLTRNLIKLDDIETEGKENIRQARKEAIKCIQKCIAVLEAKAESNSQAAKAIKNNDVEMNTNKEDNHNDGTEAKSVDCNTEDPNSTQPSVNNGLLKSGNAGESEKLVVENTPQQVDNTLNNAKAEEMFVDQNSKEAEHANQILENNATSEDGNENSDMNKSDTETKKKSGLKKVFKRDKSKDKSDKKFKESKESHDVMQVDDKGEAKERMGDGAGNFPPVGSPMEVDVLSSQ